MKAIILVLMGLSSLSAIAQDAASVCMDLSFRSSRTECMRTIQSGYLDNGAVRLCSRLSFDSNINECLKVSLDKEYSSRDLRYCENQTFRSDIVDCMKHMGEHIRRNSRSERRHNRDKIRKARQEVYTGSVVVNSSREGHYDHNEYVACYERPKSRLVTYTNERQARRGRGKVIGGAAGAIFGQIFGAVTGEEEIGDAISVVGAAVAVYGAVEVADASEIIYLDNGYDCRSYYQADRRVYNHRIERKSCTTKRYYSNRWGQEHEYFETTCSGRTYMTFERNTEIWYN